MIPVLNDKFKKQVMGVEDLILSEVNTKEIQYIDDTSGILVKKIKPNFRKLGQSYGPKVKNIAAAINSFGKDEIAAIEQTGVFDIKVDEETITLTKEDVEISSEDIPGWLVANENGITVALDITITEDLKKEGLARDVVNRIQNLRKDQGLEVQDKIDVEIEGLDELFNAAITEYSNYICTETQALSLNIVSTVEHASEIEMDEYLLKINIKVK